MSKLHYFTALLLIVLLAVASGWLFESMETNPIAEKEEIRHDPDYFLENFTATTMDTNGNPAYKIESSYLEHFPDDDSMALQNPFISFYENNIKIWTVQSKQAFIFEDGDKIEFEGQVELNQLKNINKKAIRLSAEQLTVEPQKSLAYTKSNIKLSQGENFIQAKGMRANMKKNRIEFLSKTRSHYVLP